MRKIRTFAAMKKLLLLLTISLAMTTVANPSASAQTPKLPEALTPAETHLFAHRDTCDLYLDIYRPAEGAETTFQGIEKPTLLFVFGGGFVAGHRREVWYHPWLGQLLAEGYPVVAIDYRLGLKGVDMKFDLFHIVESCHLTKKAVDMGVEDVFSAVKFLIDSGLAQKDNIVIMGNSAGAMISLSAEMEACNHSELAAELPEDFHFKGVMSFAGAIMTVTGVPKYNRTPAPQMLVHGSEDGAVTYNKTAFGKLGMYGSSSLVKQVYSKKGYVYHFYRYPGHSHDMAGNMEYLMKEQLRFLEEEVMLGRGRIIDVSVLDPKMFVGEEINLDTIYGLL